MRKLLADVNFEGQLNCLLSILFSPEWAELWNSYNCDIETFANLGLIRETKDRAVWERCQREGLILLTGNRNDDGPDSLEAAIRDSPPDSLPVVTIGTAKRILEEKAYAHLVAIELMNYVHDLRYHPESILGSGRLYIPKNTPVPIHSAK